MFYSNVKYYKKYVYVLCMFAGLQVSCQGLNISDEQIIRLLRSRIMSEDRRGKQHIPVCEWPCSVRFVQDSKVRGEKVNNTGLLGNCSTLYNSTVFLLYFWANETAAVSQDTKPSLPLKPAVSIQSRFGSCDWTPPRKTCKNSGTRRRALESLPITSAGGRIKGTENEENIKQTCFIWQGTGFQTGCIVGMASTWRLY